MLSMMVVSSQLMVLVKRAGRGGLLVTPTLSFTLCQVFGECNGVIDERNIKSEAGLMFEICWQKLASNSIEKKKKTGSTFLSPMEFMIFYAFVIVLATVASAPVGNDVLDGGTTLCDFTTEDCPLVFNTNDYTTPPTGLDQASGGAGAGTEPPSAFSQLNFFTIASSDAALPKYPAPHQRWSATYECEEPLPAIRQGHNFFDQPLPPLPPYQSGDSAKKFPADQDDSSFIPCQKCIKGSDCRPMSAICLGEENPYRCLLCPSSNINDHTECERVADISKLPSKGNSYGQSWCKTGECQAWGQHCDPLLRPLSLDCL